MGAQWKHAGREANANKKGKIVGKLVKEIIVATKMGDANPDNNPRLRAAVEAARKNSVTRDTIERAIKKGSGQTDETIVYEMITYEGFAPHRVPLIIECLTENRNRTAADIRGLFKRNAQLGNSGSVAWMFDRLGVIEATHVDNKRDIEGDAIESGCQNVEPLEASESSANMAGGRFFTALTDLDSCNKALTQMGWVVTLSELSYIAKSPADVTEEQKAEVVQFLNEIDDNDDVHRIYTALA